MKYKGFLYILLALVVLLTSASGVFAGTGKKIATAGATELLIPVGARSTALAGASIAQVSGIDAMYWNPAGVANSMQNTEAMFSHLQWIGDIDVNYLAVATKLGAVGSLGLSVKTLNFGDIMETTIENPNGTGRIFSPSYLTAGLTYSRKMTDRILFGVTGKLVSEKIIGTSASGMAVDLGLQYQSAESGLKLGIVLANLGSNMKFEGNDLEHRVIMPGTENGAVSTSVAVPTASFDMPTQFKIGVGYGLNFQDVNNVELMGTFVSNNYAYDQYIVGAEYDFNKMVFVRGAYALAYKEGLDTDDEGFVSSDQDFLFGPSFGAGFKLGIGGNMTLSVDYAYQTTEFFDNNQWFSFVFGF